VTATDLGPLFAYQAPIVPPTWRHDRVGWTIAWLRNNAHVVRAFNRRCHERIRENPTRKFGAKSVFEDIRDHGPHAQGDEYGANNNLTSVLTRLFNETTDGEPLRTKGSKGWFLDCTPAERDAIRAAYREASAS
jgi:hypothetical protein